MPVEVHAEPLKRRYVADWLSLACLLNFLVLAGAAVLPVYIAWATRLWQKEVIRFEQLDVAYRSQLVVQVQGVRGPAGGYRAPFTAMWTTSPAANDLLGPDVLRGVIVRSSFEDVNHDGLRDVLRIKATVPLGPEESVHAATVVAYVDAQLHDVTRLKVDGVLSASYASGVPGQRWVLDGDVTLRQRAPLPKPTAGIYVPYLDAPLPSLAAASSPRDASPEGILAAAAGRNFTLRWEPTGAPLWVPDPVVPSAALDVSALGAVGPRAFELSLTARVPLGPVVVRPSIAEELKHGWIQYIALLAVTGTVAWLIRRVLFGLRVVDTTVLADAPRSLTKLHAA